MSVPIAVGKNALAVSVWYIHLLGVRYTLVFSDHISPQYES